MTLATAPASIDRRVYHLAMKLRLVLLLLVVGVVLGRVCARDARTGKA